MQKYSIDRSLNGGTVLLTGVTGFVGGALLERILHLDPGPARIFVLVRKKRGIDPHSRFNAYLTSPLFSTLDSRCFEKIEVIPGDVTIDGLGLSDQNLHLLLSTCTHVFHSAASISFAAQLESAVKINLLGTRYILRLTKSMENIKAMVHVSTAYVNCTGNSDECVEERVYPSKHDPIEFTDMIAKMSSKEIERRSKEFLGDHSNTYTFTKNMAENLLQAERGDVPLSIVRPSIVLSSWKQPVSGWVDNVKNGACGLIAGIGRGIFRTEPSEITYVSCHDSFQAKPEARVDIIPVDMVVSTILAASIHAEKNPEKCTVFHCTSSSENSTTWFQYCHDVVKYCRMHPCKFAAWHPDARPRRNWFRHIAVYWLFQLLPAYAVNLIWQFIRPGRKHVLLKVQEKYSRAEAYTRFFAKREWTFSRRNAMELEKGLEPNERSSHPMNPNEIEWDRYFEICVLGVRRYYHTEGSTTTDRAVSFMRRLEIVAAIAPLLFFIIFWYLLAVLLPGSLSTTSSAFLAGFIVFFLSWL